MLLGGYRQVNIPTVLIRCCVYSISEISIQPLDVIPENAEGKLQGVTRKKVVREDENSTEFP